MRFCHVDANAFAAFKFTPVMNFVARSTGRSVGFAPLSYRGAKQSCYSLLAAISEIEHHTPDV